MKFSTILTTAATSFALAQARTVRFFTESNDTQINHKGLYSTHEGAGINYMFLGGDDAQNYTVTDYGEIFLSQDSADGSTFKQTLSIVNYPNVFPYLQLSVTPDNVNWYIDDGYLSGNGSDNFWVAKNTSDPYNFSQYSYTIGLFLNGSTNPKQYDAAARVKILADIQD